MAKVKVIYRVRSLDIKPRDTAMVDEDVAEQLVANGHAVLSKDAPAEVKGTQKS